MKFPSLTSLAGAARSTLVRFPLVLLMGLVGAVSIIAETDDMRLPFVSLLGISLLFGLASSTLLTVLVIPAIYVALRDDGRPATPA